VKILITLATAVALVGPALAGGAEIPKVYRGNWCQPVINGGPFYSPGYCKNGEDEAWIKITDRNVKGWVRIRNINNGKVRDLSDAACQAIAIKPDTSSHLVTFRCDGVGTVMVRLDFVPRSGDGRKSPRLYIDEVSPEEAECISGASHLRGRAREELLDQCMNTL
jgi:hypothetical protein